MAFSKLCAASKEQGGTLQTRETVGSTVTLRLVEQLWLGRKGHQWSGCPSFTLQPCLSVVHAYTEDKMREMLPFAFSDPSAFPLCQLWLWQMAIFIPGEFHLTLKFKPKESRQSSNSSEEAKVTDGGQPNAVPKLGVRNTFNSVYNGITTTREESTQKRQETHSSWVLVRDNSFQKCE